MAMPHMHGHPLMSQKQVFQLLFSQLTDLYEIWQICCCMEYCFNWCMGSSRPNKNNVVF